MSLGDCHRSHAYFQGYLPHDKATHKKSVSQDKTAFPWKNQSADLFYEEYQRGTILEILDYIASNPLKGECLLIVAGASENDREGYLTSDVALIEAVEGLIASGMKPNQAIKTIAKERKINRQELYNLFHGV